MKSKDLMLAEIRLERTVNAAYHALLAMSAWLGIPESKRKAHIDEHMENVIFCSENNLPIDFNNIPQEEFMCPHCKSTNIVTERSPDGESFCRDCGKRWSNREIINPLSAAADRTQDAVEPILKYFHYEHLPEKLKGVSKPFSDLAHKMVADLPRNPERSAGLRKLLEAKDCAVRCTL